MANEPGSVSENSHHRARSRRSPRRVPCPRPPRPLITKGDCHAVTPVCHAPSFRLSRWGVTLPLGPRITGLTPGSRPCTNSVTSRRAWLRKATDTQFSRSGPRPPPRPDCVLRLRRQAAGEHHQRGGDPRPGPRPGRRLRRTRRWRADPRRHRRPPAARVRRRGRARALVVLGHGLEDRGRGRLPRGLTRDVLDQAGRVLLARPASARVRRLVRDRVRRLMRDRSRTRKT